MAQLRDTAIDGNLEVTGGTILKTNGIGVYGIHPETGATSSMLSINSSGNTLVGYGGYINKNGNSHICGNDINHFVASADISYRPYYREGDTINFKVKTAGYVTNSGQYVAFTIPITKPVIGAPTATITSSNGLILRQNNEYTHGSASNARVKPTRYDIDANYNSGFIVIAVFSNTTNAINNNAIGIDFEGTITLS